MCDLLVSELVVCICCNKEVASTKMVEADDHITAIVCKECEIAYDEDLINEFVSETEIELAQGM